MQGQISAVRMRTCAAAWGEGARSPAMGMGCLWGSFPAPANAPGRAWREQWAKEHRRKTGYPCCQLFVGPQRHQHIRPTPGEAFMAEPGTVCRAGPGVWGCAEKL